MAVWARWWVAPVAAALAAGSARPADDDPLPAGARARLGTARFRLPFMAPGVALSPDGGVVAVADSGDQNRTVRLVDRRTWAAVRTLEYPTPAGVRRVLFSPTGRAVAAATHDRVTVWEVATGRRIGEVAASRSPSARDGFGLSADGRRVAVAAEAAGEVRVRVVEAATGAVVREVTPARPGLPANPLAGGGIADFAPVLSPDGGRVAGPVPGPSPGDADGLVQVWDVATGRELARAEVGAGRAAGVAFSPDGGTVYTQADDGPVRAWDVAAGRLLRQYPGRPGAGTGLFLSPDGRTLAAAGQDGWVEAWEAATARRLGPARLPAAGDRYGVGFPADGPAVALTADFGTARAWAVPGGQPVTPEPRPAGGARAVGFTPDGRQVVATDLRGEVVRWDAATGRAAGSAALEAPWVHLRVRAVGPAWHKLALAPGAGRSAIPHGPLGLLVHDLDRPADPVLLAPRAPGGYFGSRPAFSADGGTVAAVGARMSVWDVRTGQQVAEVAVPPDPDRGGGGGRALALAADGARLVAAESLYRQAGHVVRVAAWDLPGGGPAGQAEHPARYVRTSGTAADQGAWAAVHPDGRAVVFAGRDGWLDVADVAAGRVARRIAAPGEAFGPAPAFSPDGRRLAVAAVAPGDRPDRPTGRAAVRVVEWASGAVRHEFLGPAPADLLFDPAGHTLATTHGDGSVLLWDLSPAAGPRPWEAAPTSPADLWVKLVSADAGRAWAAVRELAARPGVAVPLLRDKVRTGPPPAATEAEIDKLVGDLDAPAFARREDAGRRLRELGPAAEPRLRRAAEGGSPEARRRAADLLAALARPDPDLVPHTRAVEALEAAATPAANDLLREWAAGAGPATLVREAKAALARAGR